MLASWQPQDGCRVSPQGKIGEARENPCKKSLSSIFLLNNQLANRRCRTALHGRRTLARLIPRRYPQSLLTSLNLPFRLQCPIPCRQRVRPLPLECSVTRRPSTMKAVAKKFFTSLPYLAKLLHLHYPQQICPSIPLVTRSHHRTVTPIASRWQTVFTILLHHPHRQSFTRPVRMAPNPGGRGNEHPMNLPWTRA